MAAVQGNGGKLADVLDGAVPGEAVVHIGNHAQVHAVPARPLQNFLHDAALAGSGEKNLIDKMLADILKERIKRPTTSLEFAEKRAPEPGKSMNPLKV